MNKNPSVSSSTEKFFIAYTWAATAAAAAILIVGSISKLIRGSGHASAHPSIEDVLLILIAFVPVWVIAFSTAIVPCFITYFIASHWHIRHVAYFAVCGALAGAISCPILLLLPMPADVPNDPPLMESYLYMLPIFLISGACSGITFWYKRLYREQAEPTPDA